MSDDRYFRRYDRITELVYWWGSIRQFSRHYCKQDETGRGVVVLFTE